MSGVRAATVLLLTLARVTAGAEPEPRFVVAGDGQLAFEHAHTGARVAVRYRRADGTYDPAALAAIRRGLRSQGDPGEGLAALRLIELLGRVQRLGGGAPLRVMSGYRSPAYNETIRQRGAQAAGGSLHTEGLAADLAFPRARLGPLWRALRALDCCGAGYYAADGFLHVDVGRPRVWEAATSRVGENLSAGNARVFARTEYDRYAAGEPIVVTLHALTMPPVRVARAAALEDADGTSRPLVLGGPLAEHDGCLEVPATGSALEARGAPAAARGRVVVHTCAPRPERTPERIASNPIVVR